MQEKIRKKTAKKSAKKIYKKVCSRKSAKNLQKYATIICKKLQQNLKKICIENLRKKNLQKVCNENVQKTAKNVQKNLQARFELLCAH